MKKLSTIWVLVILLFAASTANALEIIELRQENSNKVIIRLMFSNGSIADPEGKEGLTALTATLISEGGTAVLTKAEIDELIYPMAASHAVTVDKEVSTFTFQVHVDHLEQFYLVIKGLILTPSLTEQDFNRVKAAQLNYVTRGVRHSSDENYSKFALEDFLYRGTNYQHMVSGNETGVNSITLEDVKNHYATYFTRDNLLIGIAGKYTTAFIDRLGNDLVDLPPLTAKLPVAGQAPATRGVEVEIVSKPGALGSAIYLGYPLSVNRSDNNHFPSLLLAASYLGEHRNSYGRLFHTIREVRSMNYGTYSYVEWYPEGSRNLLPPSGYPRQNGYFSIWIRPVQTAASLRNANPEMKDVKLGHAHFALRMAIHELDVLIADGIAQESFELTRKFLRSYMKLYVQRPVEQLGYLMDSRFFGRENYIEEMDRLIAALDREKVNGAVREHFQVQNMKITVITDPEEAQALAESLKENAPSPMRYTPLVEEGLPRQVFEEDGIVQGYPLNVTKVTIIDSDKTFRKNY